MRDWISRKRDGVGNSFFCNEFGRSWRAGLNLEGAPARDVQSHSFDVEVVTSTALGLDSVPIPLPEAAMQMLTEPETSLELEHRILERIAGRVRNLRVVRSAGRLILEGSSGSFHAKQLATHAALAVAPEDELVNAITVDRQLSDCIPRSSRRY